ncbi:CRISPR-associated protein Cas1 [Agrobacterium vitis]|nr:CRISPR-associated protein Cas1 [Agrobacterium vitis]MBE1438433.1 CRISPR-associated protein Cas1 [Agrobacterium vitis]
MDRIVDIATDGQHLAIYRGFLTVSSHGEERGRIALDDIGALIVHAHGTTWTNHVFVKMAERNVPVVLCASNHAPVSVVWPLEGHHAQGARLRAQIDASKPLQKQLWQKVVAAKIRMQGHVLTANGHEAGAFDLLARKVKSGDSGNVEAQAARRYWKALFGNDFLRDQNAEGANSLLNYGYTILRAIVSRAICASGLHPTIGIFHSNRANAFALADDLMEPYRPLVDQMVLNLIRAGINEVSPAAKKALTSITTFDLETPVGVSPLSVQVNRFVHSFAVAFETGQAQLELPALPSAAELAGLGLQTEEEDE